MNIKIYMVSYTKWGINSTVYSLLLLF